MHAKTSIALGFPSQHIKKFIFAAVTALALSGGNAAKAQRLVMPERWTEGLHSVKPIFTRDTLTIRILGDMMMHEMQIAEAGRNDGTFDFSSYFRFIEDEIREADISVANMEFTLAGKPYTGYPSFSAPDSFADYLAECGFDIFLTANNHIFDKGARGTERTLDIYRNLEATHGVRFTGTASDQDEMDSITPLFIRAKGIKLAFLNFTYGTNTGSQSVWPQTTRSNEKERLEKAISRAEENNADFLIALPHWGPEYRLTHSQSQRKTAQWLAENGADWIIGSHPHVVQDSETIGGVPVVYSLGNAVSNMSAANTQLELMVTIRIVREGNGNVMTLPLEFEYLWCSRPGGYCGSYTVLPVREFIGREAEWKNPYDYHKMMTTYERVRKETGISND